MLLTQCGIGNLTSPDPLYQPLSALNCDKAVAFVVPPMGSDFVTTPFTIGRIAVPPVTIGAEDGCDMVSHWESSYVPLKVSVLLDDGATLETE